MDECAVSVLFGSFPRPDSVEIALGPWVGEACLMGGAPGSSWPGRPRPLLPRSQRSGSLELSSLLSARAGRPSCIVPPARLRSWSPRCAPTLPPCSTLPRRGPSTVPRGPEPAERLPAGDLNGAAGPGAEGPAEGTGGPGRLPEGRPCVDAAGAGSVEQPVPSLPPGALWLEGKHLKDGATNRPWPLQGL